MGVTRMGMQRGPAVGGQSLLAEQFGGRGLGEDSLTSAQDIDLRGQGQFAPAARGFPRGEDGVLCPLAFGCLNSVTSWRVIVVADQDLTGPRVLSHYNSAC